MKPELTKISGTPEEVERAFGLNILTLAKWRHESKGPKYRKIGRRVYYIFSEVQEFLDNHMVLTRDSMNC
jgi:hypothetical protein